jgi:hypothetical protein
MYNSIARAVIQFIAGRFSGTTEMTKSEMINTAIGALITGLTLWWSYNDKKKPTDPPSINVNLMIGLFLVGMITSGCASYRHSRQADPTTGIMTEETSVRAPWLTKTAIQGLKTRTTESRTKDKSTYSRSVGVDATSVEADVEGINALRALLGDALIQALKTSVKP